MNALQSIYEDELDCSEFLVEIHRFKRLVRSSRTVVRKSSTWGLHVCAESLSF